MTATIKKKPHSYNTDEIGDMRRAGYLTPRAAAEMYSVNLSMAYRATLPREVGGKLTEPAVRVRLGVNPRNRYLHAKDWAKYMEAKREAIQRRFGITSVR